MVVEVPLHIATPALGVIVGNGFTVTVTVAVLLQLEPVARKSNSRLWETAPQLLPTPPDEDPNPPQFKLLIAGLIATKFAQRQIG